MEGGAAAAPGLAAAAFHARGGVQPTHGVAWVARAGAAVLCAANSVARRPARAPCCRRLPLRASMMHALPCLVSSPSVAARPTCPLLSALSILNHAKHLALHSSLLHSSLCTQSLCTRAFALEPLHSLFHPFPCFLQQAKGEIASLADVTKVNAEVMEEELMHHTVRRRRRRRRRRRQGSNTEGMHEEVLHHTGRLGPGSACLSARLPARLRAATRTARLPASLPASPLLPPTRPPLATHPTPTRVDVLLPPVPPPTGACRGASGSRGRERRRGRRLGGVGACQQLCPPGTDGVACAHTPHAREPFRQRFRRHSRWVGGWLVQCGWARASGGTAACQLRPPHHKLRSLSSCACCACLSVCWEVGGHKSLAHYLKRPLQEGRPASSARTAAGAWRRARPASRHCRAWPMLWPQCGTSPQRWQQRQVHARGGGGGGVGGWVCVGGGGGGGGGGGRRRGGGRRAAASAGGGGAGRPCTPVSRHGGKAHFVFRAPPLSLSVSSSFCPPVFPSCWRCLTSSGFPRLQGAAEAEAEKTFRHSLTMRRSSSGAWRGGC